jgi:putative hydrolase of the HAD superfamily
MKPKMVLFDYGGTLMYEPDFSPKRCNTAIFPYIIKNPYNITPDELDNFIQTLFEDIRKLRGEKIEIHEHLFLRYVLEYLGLELSVSIEEAERIMFNSMANAKSTPNSSQMLKNLQNMGIKTGVISNLCWSGSALSERLKTAFPKHNFEFIMTTSEYIFRKPDKHIFDLAVRKSGFDADEVWYCGNDIEIDIVGAYKAGLFPVLYDDRTVLSNVHEKNDAFDVKFPFLRISSWNELIDNIIIKRS